ncbi:Putative Ubiquitin conjugating enzyme [Aspergillus calidoustus]|uniref:Putative Ubiquitin conjugating enzyme n=1 Tax=Aspergillus calidoustus TaxID=454130 RepID=A0A0U4ZGR5_ASPCI|nr:Putative Ubiquitin conjugating enzyme [Aspergillus calidoustus]
MSRSVRRLMKEASELSSSPSPHFTAAPVSDSNLYDWHFTIAGPPPPSPYAGGIYHGRIVLPPTYPLRPPSFRFLTPSGRFEVNREICLSISGHHEETWQPAWGIRTALIAIRSFMDGDVKGQVGGLDGVSDAIKKEWAVASRGWRCEACGEGKSNEQVLSEWRGFCVEQGVNVEKEEEAEGVPEELRLGVKKADGNNETDTAKDAHATATPSPGAGQMGGGSTEVPVKTGGSVPVPASSTSTTTSMPPSTQTLVPPQSNGPRPITSQPRLQPQQRQPTTTTSTAPTRRQTAPPASQDSPWLDRAIFGVLIALVLMILRRFVDIED